MSWKLLLTDIDPLWDWAYPRSLAMEWGDELNGYLPRGASLKDGNNLMTFIRNFDADPPKDNPKELLGRHIRKFDKLAVYVIEDLQDNFVVSSRGIGLPWPPRPDREDMSWGYIWQGTQPMNPPNFSTERSLAAAREADVLQRMSPGDLIGRIADRDGWATLGIHLLKIRHALPKVIAREWIDLSKVAYDRLRRADPSSPEFKRFIRELYAVLHTDWYELDLSVVRGIVKTETLKLDDLCLTEVLITSEGVYLALPPYPTTAEKIYSSWARGEAYIPTYSNSPTK